MINLCEIQHVILTRVCLEKELKRVDKEICIMEAFLRNEPGVVRCDLPQNVCNSPVEYIRGQLNSSKHLKIDLEYIIDIFRIAEIHFDKGDSHG